MNDSPKVVLVTGGARRIGRAICQRFAKQGYRVIIHYHHSYHQAVSLMQELNAHVKCAKLIQADLAVVNDKERLSAFVEQVLDVFGRLDVLVHNASSFYPTDLQTGFDDLQHAWEDLLLTNAKAPLFLSKAFYDELAKRHGAIVSLLDIHARDKPFLGYPIYNMAKSAHLGMVQSLALEFAPTIRVNGVSPGVNVFPENAQNQHLNNDTQQALIESVPLGKIGTPQDIAQAVEFLATAPYITGQILAVDGGRSLTLKNG